MGHLSRNVVVMTLTGLLGSSLGSNYLPSILFYKSVHPSKASRGSCNLHALKHPACPWCFQNHVCISVWSSTPKLCSEHLLSSLSLAQYLPSDLAKLDDDDFCSPNTPCTSLLYTFAQVLLSAWHVLLLLLPINPVFQIHFDWRWLSLDFSNCHGQMGFLFLSFCKALIRFYLCAKILQGVGVTGLFTHHLPNLIESSVRTETVLSSLYSSLVIESCIIKTQN